QTAEKLISTKKNAELNDMLSILKVTHQDSMTVYSNIYDLKNKTIFTYNKTNFNTPIVTKIPDAFHNGDCVLPLDSLARNPNLKDCYINNKTFTVTGKIVDENEKPIPYVNIGISEKNIGTLSDPDGSF